jgi:AraC-like DNA-binding protein
LDVLNIISISGTVIGVLAMAIIAIKHKRNRYQKVLFLAFLFCLTYNCFLTYMVVSGLILDYPHFYRTASPFIYGIPISLFLLGKAIGKNQDRPSRWDLLLVLIPVIHALELTPFYFQSAEYKLLHLQSLRTNPDIMIFDSISLIPNQWHYFLQFTLGSVLMGITFGRTLKYRKSTGGTSRRRKLIWINWIALFLGACFALLVFLIMADTRTYSVYLYGAFLFMFVLLIIFLSLFLEPHVLYGSLPSPKQQQKPIYRNSTNESLTKEENDFKALLDLYFKEETDFLKPTFRQSDLAGHMNLSRNTLSHMINKVYRVNFNQLLNEKRIEIALKNLENSNWENLSLEGVALEVGFKSRTTFNKAFKLKTGCTPSKYKIA